MARRFLQVATINDLEQQKKCVALSVQRSLTISTWGCKGFYITRTCKHHVLYNWNSWTIKRFVRDKIGHKKRKTYNKACEVHNNVNLIF